MAVERRHGDRHLAGPDEHDTAEVARDRLTSIGIRFHRRNFGDHPAD